MSVTPTRSLTISSDGARQALFDHFQVRKLTEDVADLTRIIAAKDTTIRRLNQSVARLSLAGSPLALRPPPVPPELSRSLARARLENWLWRGLFVYLTVEVVRSALN